MNRNQSLNVIKGIAALSVIVIHSPLQGEISQLIIAFARSSVAVFFVISGFYALDRNLELSREKIQKKLYRILRLSAVAYIGYLIWGCFQRFTGSGAASVYSWFQELLQPSTLVKIFVLHEDVLAGHLWFLNALICCYVVTIVTGKLFSKKMGFLLAGILLAVQFAVGYFLPFALHAEIPSSFYRNGWFYGIPFFVWGIYIRKQYEAGKLKIADKALVTGGILSFLLIALERTCLGYHQLYLGNVLLLFFVFVWCMNNPQTLNNRVAVALGEDYSTLIYIEHWGIMALMDKIFRIIGWEQHTFFLFVVSVIGTLIAVVITKPVIRVITGKNR